MCLLQSGIFQTENSEDAKAYNKGGFRNKVLIWGRQIKVLTFSSTEYQILPADFKV